jgi:hypothetical protein
MNEQDQRQLFQHWKPPLPPRTKTAEGAERRIGVELEMIGLTVDEVSRLVARHVGGRLEKISRYEHSIRGDEAGDWGVEFDFEYLKQKGREGEGEGEVDDELRALLDQAAEHALRAGAETVVPVEVVTPPLPLSRLSEVQSLIAGLRSAGAQGTGAGISYAFGMQFNPELPALDAVTMLGYLKAFLCLYDWLMERSAPDITRRLTRFTAPFPGGYVRKIVDPGYWPERDTLIDDYLADNPTRNRALDMLPLFLHLDRQRVRAIVDDPRVKPRPTLHYRLPNSEIDRESWGIHLAWLDWLEVEKLAADHDKLDRLCAEYATWLDHPLDHVLENWSREIESWLSGTGDR